MFPLQRLLLMAGWGWAGLALWPAIALSQITPDGTLGPETSVVTPNVAVQGAPADLIQGGAQRGAGLFHSFATFNVAEQQRVYFANPSGVSAIVSRVTGGDASRIFGTLGVDGSASLFLLNPQGILFGPNAQLDIPGSFTASTGNGFTFQDGSVFSATTPGPAPLVTVSIVPGIQWGPDAPAALVNQGALAVGQTLHLAAGSVTSTGCLTAGGQVTVEAVRGDAEVAAVTASSALLSARGRLNLPQSQIQVAQDLTLQAQDTVRVRDSAETPVRITAGGNLTIRGEQGIDILALNHSVIPFVSGGDLTLLSDGIISGDAHYASGGNFSILTLTGAPGDFLSLYDPIILSNNTVSFGNYTGPSLKVVAGNNINASGTITINAPETGAAVLGDPDAAVLTGNAALILRAGVNPSSTSTFPITAGGATFTSGGPGAGNITVAGAIVARDTSGANLPGWVEILSTGGNINTGAITAGGDGTDGTITLTTTAGTLTTGALVAGGDGGDGSVAATVAGNLTVGAIAAGGAAGVGDVTLTATGNNRTLALTGPIAANNGDVTVSAAGAGSGINLGGNVAAGSGDVSFSGPVNLTVAATATVSGNDVTFNGAVNGARSLTINNTPGGNTLFGAAVGGTTALSALTVTTSGSGTVTANNALNVTNDVNITAGDGIALNGANTIGGNATFTTTQNNAAISVGQATITGAVSLNTATNGNATLTGPAVGNLGPSSVGGNLLVNSGSAISSAGPITVGGNATVTATLANAAIALAGLNVTGTVAVNTAGTGDATLSSQAGQTLTLTVSNVGGNLAVTTPGANTRISGAPITTGGSQTYNSPVRLANALVTLNGPGGITFNSTVNSDAVATPRSLIVNSTGTTTFNGQVGNLAPLASLTTNAGGQTILNTTAISTTGNQTYGDGVRLDQNTTLNATTGAVQFNAPVNSPLLTPRSLTINAGGTVNLASVGEDSDRALSALTIATGGTAALGGALRTTGNLTVTAAGAINAGSNLLTVGGNATFSTSNATAPIIANQIAATGVVRAITTGATSNVTLGSPGNITLGTSSVNGNLSVTAAGTIGQAFLSALVTTGAATFTTTLADRGDVTLRNSNANFVLGASNVGGNLTLTGNNSALSRAPGPGNLNVAGTLILNSLDSFNLGAGIYNLSAVDASGNVTIAQAGTVDVSAGLDALGLPNVGGVRQVGGNLTVQATDQGFTTNFSGTPAITLNQAGNNFGGTVRVNTPIPTPDAVVPAIVQGAAIAITGNTTLNANGGNITLNDTTNRFNGWVSLQGNNATLRAATNSDIDLREVNLTGTLDVILTGGNITNSGTVVAGDTTLISDGGFFFCAPFFCFASQGTVAITGAGNQLANLTLRGAAVTIQEDGAIALASVETPGPLTLTAGTTISQTGAISAPGAVSLTAGGNITLNHGSNNFGDLTLTANSATLTDSTAVNFAAATTTGNLAVTAGGAITQTGALSVGGTTSLSGAANQPIILTNPTNHFTGAITLGPDPLGSVQITDTSAITQLNGVTANSTLSVTNLTPGSSLSLGGPLSTSLGVFLTADGIALNGNAVTATNPIFGSIRLQPLTPTAAITLTNATASLLSAPTITIGRDNGTGVVTIADSLTLNGNTLIQGGSVIANGNITTEGRSVTLLARAPGGVVDTDGQSIITTGNGGAHGGNVTLRSLQGNVIFGNLFTQAFGGGNGGNILIEGQRIEADGAVVDPFTGGSDDAGRTGSTTLNAFGPAAGGAGDIVLAGVTLYGDNNGQNANAAGGNVSLSSANGSIQLLSSGFQRTSVQSTNRGSGPAGNVTLSAPLGDVILQGFGPNPWERSEIVVRGVDGAFGGNVTITGRNVLLDQANIIAETSRNTVLGPTISFLGTPGFEVLVGNVRIQGTGGTGNLEMSGDSLITARGIGDSLAGGNIVIAGMAQIIASAPGVAGNDMITSASGPFGGFIDTQLSVIVGFGVQQLDSLGDAEFLTLRGNNFNDIASSGRIAFLDFSLLDDRQDVDLNFVDASSLVGDACARTSEGSFFTVSGRGGLPTDPTGPLFPLAPQQGWLFLEEESGTGTPSAIAPATLPRLSQLSRNPLSACLPLALVPRD